MKARVSKTGTKVEVLIIKPISLCPLKDKSLQVTACYCSDFLCPGFSLISSLIWLVENCQSFSLLSL